jgi:hypothetical protein
MTESPEPGMAVVSDDGQSVEVDGVRIAKRIDGAWVSLKPGCIVTDLPNDRVLIEYPKSIEEARHV